MNGDRSGSDIEKVGDTLSSSSHNLNNVKPQNDAVKPFDNATTSQDRETKPLSSDEQYSLPKPDGDQWEILFRPKLEADTLRCNAWKDEVQNLLIFAGLFSAVVTAFIIESYKFLQPDPNDAIIGLLFHISNSLNNTAAFPPSVSSQAIITPFLQTPSSIRINVFWIISLIFSLATVLIGTIALQWLREHQSYSGYSNSQEKLAIFHMRSAALKAWYLPQVFAMLPLLLQGALVLFLAGLIDFSSRLGSKLTVPVSIVIGLTLLFLAATTFFPSLQGLLFLCGLYPRRTVPNPCPFKSPQSHALRMLVGFVLRNTLLHLFPSPDLRSESNIWFKWMDRVRLSLLPDHLAPSVYTLWSERTWLDFDREWLSLRDACHQRILDDDPYLYYHRKSWEKSFPLSDITECVVEAVNETRSTQHTELFLIALVHCFQELSESIWTVPRIFFFQRKDRRNNYFEQLHWNPSCSMSKFLIHGGDYKFHRFSTQEDLFGLHDYLDLEERKRLFCDDQTVTCLSKLRVKHSSPFLAQYQYELWSRILHTSTRTPALTPATISGSTVPFPTIVDIDTLSDLFDVSDDQRPIATANVLGTLLQLAAVHSTSKKLVNSPTQLNTSTSERQPINVLSVHPHMVSVFGLLADSTSEYLELYPKDAPGTKEHVIQVADKQFVKIFEIMRDHIIEERANSLSSSQEQLLGVCFYIPSMFLWRLLVTNVAGVALRDKDRNFGQALKSLLDALHETWTFSRKNETIETQFRLLEDNYGEIFSDGWWDQLFKHRSIAQAPMSQNSRCEFVSGTVDHPNDNVLHSSSSSPAVSNRTVMSMEGPNTVNDPVFSNSQPPVLDPQKPASVIPQQGMANNDGHNLQPEIVHSTLINGLSTVVGQVEPVDVYGSDPPQDQLRQPYVSIGIEYSS